VAEPAIGKGDPEKTEAQKAWERMSVPVELSIHHGGGTTNLRKSLNTKKGLHTNYTWNVGDIDFDTDGSIFIRNPYLADAIQELIARNRDKREKGELTPKGNEQFLFRLTRDEGWSGEKQNIVC
jgi:hypothetical protein